MNNQIIKYFLFIISSIFLSGLFILISELTKFSHLNLLSFGGNSWGLWTYSFFIALSFGLMSKLFNISKPIIIFLLLLFVFLIISFFVFNGKVFVNFTPFNY